MRNIISLLLKLKGVMVDKPIVTIAVGTLVIAAPVAGIATYNYAETQKDQKQVTYKGEDNSVNETTKQNLEEKRQELKEKLKEENEDLSDEELDKLVEENLKADLEEGKEDLSKNNVDKPVEDTVKNDPDKEVTQTNPIPKLEDKPEYKLKPQEIKPNQNPTPKPEEPAKPTPTPKPEESAKQTKPSGIDWALSSQYFDAIANGNSNDPILPVDEWNKTADGIFLNGGSANDVVNALNAYRYKGKEVFFNYGEGIGVGARRVSLGAEPNLNKVYDIVASVMQYKNYVYLRVYYDANLEEYILFYVNGTCDVDPFVFG